MRTLKIGVLADEIKSVDSEVSVAQDSLEKGIEVAKQDHPGTKKIEIVCDFGNINLKEIAEAISSNTNGMYTVHDIGELPPGESLFDYADAIVSIGGDDEAMAMVALFQEWGCRAYEYEL